MKKYRIKWVNMLGALGWAIALTGIAWYFVEIVLKAGVLVRG